MAAAAFVLAGCSDRAQAPLAPEVRTAPAAPSHLLGVDVNGLLQFIGPPNLLAPRHAEKYIRAADGGFVELNGFRVDIPAGALPNDTTVTLDLPTDLALAKRLVAEFGPHGVQFNTPVTLSFPLAGVLMNGSPFQVVRWEDDHWVGLGGWLSADGSRIYGTTPHFSTYGGREKKDVMGGG
jgi:hypothetical protein